MSACRDCRFWVKGGNQPGHVQECHPDDMLGACHRRAPVPQFGEHIHVGLKFLAMIAWPVSDEKQKGTDFEDWEEAETNGSTHWPDTGATEWCGEFEERP